MAKKQSTKIKRDRSLAEDVISSEFLPPPPDVLFAVRAGRRAKIEDDVALDHALSTTKKKKK